MSRASSVVVVVGARDHYVRIARRVRLADRLEPLRGDVARHRRRPADHCALAGTRSVEMMRCSETGARCGFTDGGSGASPNRPFHPYALRHFAATGWLRAGAGLDEVRRFLGHESRTTVLRDSSLVGADLRRAHRKAGAIERLRVNEWFLRCGPSAPFTPGRRRGDSERTPGAPGPSRRVSGWCVMGLDGNRCLPRIQPLLTDWPERPF